MSRLTQIIHLFYRMQDNDIAALEKRLLDARKRSWSAALNELAADYGCNRRANAPRRDDLRELKAQCKRDAQSIAKTYDRDLEREIERLYAANPRGNRSYYAARLERWLTARAAWKNAQIGLQTDITARELARKRFREMNGQAGKGAQYIFEPRSAVCRVCLRLIARGVVDQKTVDSTGDSQHINCPHFWRLINPKRVRCEELWIG